ncbi:phosphopantothenoylcysteine decarboxylase/phosphopantothenate/cysteine ligase [Dehalogenimonas lykanthroporepellens BL-DC-9]|jgi:phosphopantothenoylcysteine decarboxylase/phosphopantothenate--cysteine ligase|nr:phosphopantothenoylcysteine decarboxylase/phosphopantothenate/cysteine ligase [Dehalogenimonas lykanthroporepellens BL-DC-9]
MILKNKTIILGVTGSVAAYKAVDIASKLTQAGATVEVIMTDSAQRFVTPLSFRAVTNRQPVTSMWDMAGEFSIEHVSLAETADAVLVAPATANTIARIAWGFADDMICSTVLATKAPVIVAPAMNCNMYENAATQKNIQRLKDRGIVIIEPNSGHLACGTEGKGRLPSTDTIIGELSRVLAKECPLAGRKVVVTAGGTREPLDPVRYLGNRSSGKMGHALALAARDAGADVELISTVDFPVSAGIVVTRVETAAEMLSVVRSAVKGAHALIMAAAVADFRPVEASKDKIKKGDNGLDLKLEPTEDILSAVKGDFIRVGFAAETGDLLANARQKLSAKNLDLIVANDVTSPGAGFGAETNKVTLLFRDGRVEELPLMSKREVAERVVREMDEV